MHTSEINDLNNSLKRYRDEQKPDLRDGDNPFLVGSSHVLPSD